SATIVTAVLILPNCPAALTNPCSICKSLKPVTANSLAIIIIAITEETLSNSTSAINALATNNLSANGYKNFPILVTSCHFLAKSPSNQSVADAIIKIIAAINCSILISCPNKKSILPILKSTSKKSTKTGINITRNTVNWLGIFICFLLLYYQ